MVRERSGSTLGSEPPLCFAYLARFAHPVLVNGALGFLVAHLGRPLAVIGVTIRDDKITEIDILADPERLSRLDLTGLIP